MLIKEEALKHWVDNFYGYGSWEARFWFIGYEEPTGDMPEDVADKLNYYYDIHPSGNIELCDIRELYRHVRFKLDGPRAELFTNLFDYRFDKNATTLHGGWKNLIAFVHGYEEKPLPDLLAFQKNSFVLPSKKGEALLRLYPLPAHNHAWYYSWLDLPRLDFLKSRKRYQEHVFPSRMQRILHNMKVYKPRVVVMYGMDNIGRLKASVQEFYTEVKFQSVKATNPERIGSKIPQHHKADLPQTTLVITTQRPALRHNRIETGSDWYAFGKTLRDQG